MDLFVIVKYKRLVKNQASKIDQCNSQLACKKLVRRVTLERPCVKHMIESWRVMPGCQIRKYFARKAISQASRETLCLEKRKKVLPNSLPTLYIPWLPMKYKECFLERKHTHNHLHIFSWFSSTPTSPSLHSWEILSPNIYHTQSECWLKLIWCCWEALEGAIKWWMQSG